jgi:Phage integrase family
MTADEHQARLAKARQALSQAQARTARPHSAAAKHKIRVIKVHHLRHTTASLLKKLRVPPRDAQMILGHAQFTTTMQVYTHVDEEARNVALTGLNDLLSRDGEGVLLMSEMDVSRCIQGLPAQETPGGAKGTRTPDPLLAKQVLFQLSYSP